MKLDGFQVVDALKPIMLHITKADAQSGTKDPANCAAAKAACRLTGVIEARVYRTRTYILLKDARGKKYWRRYLTPGSVAGEIIAFDRGGTFEPGDYTLPVASKTTKLGGDPRGSRPASAWKNKAKRPSPRIIPGIREYGPRGTGDHPTKTKSNKKSWSTR